MSAIVVTREGAVATLTLNRPEALNAFTLDMAQALREAIQAVIEDVTIRAVVLTGAGRAFCAGGDIRYMHGLVRDAQWDDARALAAVGIDVVTAIARTPKPVIAALNGAAAGGGAGLALACDIRVASAGASIGLTFSAIGLHTD